MGTVTVPMNVDVPSIVAFPATVSDPPIFAFFDTPIPPAVIMDPVTSLVESVVSITFIGPDCDDIYYSKHNQFDSNQQKNFPF